MTFEMVPYFTTVSKKYLCEKQSSAHFLSLKVIGFMKSTSNYRANLGMQERANLNMFLNSYGIKCNQYAFLCRYNELAHVILPDKYKNSGFAHKCNQLKVITPNCAVQNQSYL
ncbi:Hypothetical_protein [Hexamita inflata]|uniref:Hypothetical_protein n=1 Tax=Hexamita inflata TaxID=28002 RepID=A0AA86NLL0_9EUKA|nr:Hypothetical protein HINF_LOCUS10122 [Hexamita inflata]CAI9922478.1 Hypothetical protein HINF_LOCUS10123 [Hexamita inflata]CAI9947576.1 Hypothetical protein HINF_LOCUS35221 [Hexamita inflata]CAI9947577.1 Hypothetical protein HINF_LOCUS35222 [Hexamita inflata]CAI9947579.1 Hypothetical protein HINF_LOCUS35224 [Hexamita inflata]